MKNGKTDFQAFFVASGRKFQKLLNFIFQRYRNTLPINQVKVLTEMGIVPTSTDNQVLC